MLKLGLTQGRHSGDMVQHHVETGLVELPVAVPYGIEDPLLRIRQMNCIAQRPRRR